MIPYTHLNERSSIYIYIICVKSKSRIMQTTSQKFVVLPSKLEMKIQSENAIMLVKFYFLVTNLGFGHI